MTASEKYLREVLDIPESVHAGDFKVELTGGFTETEARLAEYVVTDQLRDAFNDALSVVQAAMRDGTSHAAYLHGSFGSGKSHFLTVLHAILNNDPAARAKRKLQPVIAEHDEWLREKKFLMVPYHLVGAADIDSAIRGVYVAAVRKLHPDHPTPPVYRADAMLEDARRQRDFLNDDKKFADWIGSAAQAAAKTVHPDDLDVIAGAEISDWTPTNLDRAFIAPAGEPIRDALISALLSGPMSSYIRGASGDVAAFAIDGTHSCVMSCQHGRPMGRFAGHNVVCDLLGEPMLPLIIDWYTTILDLGAWGAVYTEGWDRQVVARQAVAKRTKETINRQRIYPPLSRDRQEILAAAAPIVQTPPAYGRSGKPSS